MIAAKLPFYVAAAVVLFQEMVKVWMVDTLHIISGAFQESVPVQLVKRSPACGFANFMEGKQVNQRRMRDVGFDERITTISY